MLEPRRRRLQCAEIASLHSSPDDRARLGKKKKKKESKEKQERKEKKKGKERKKGRRKRNAMCMTQERNLTWRLLSLLPMEVLGSWFIPCSGWGFVEL